MNNAWKVAVLFTAALMLAACNSGSSGGGSGNNGGGSDVSFSNLFAQVFAQDANAEPISVNDLSVSDDGGSLASTLDN